MRALRLSDVVAILERRYPPGSAEDWDAVGLVAGDPEREVRRVLLAVDAVADTAREAREWGADLLLSHHPVFLRAVHSVAATTAKGRLVHELIEAGCALYAAHTNADAAPGGVAEALANAAGLVESRPVQPHPVPPLDGLVTYVPVADAAAVIEALAAAGAGSVGEYESCAWVTDGVGQFRPGPAANPAIGRVGELTTVTETCVQMVLPRPRRTAVVEALRAVHPYEEPAFSVTELAAEAGASGAGRIGTLQTAVPLREFAQGVADALPATAGGVRVSGDLDGLVRTVAVCGGSGDSLLEAVREQGADVYLTADLRHHRASEARQDGPGGRPYLVDVAHWASEWPWLPRAAAALVADVEAAGATVEARVSEIVTDPWDARFVPASPTATPPTQPPQGAHL